MSGKLDQSLEEISTAHKRSARRNPRRSAGRPAAIPAPVGGIRKNPKGARGAGAKATPAKAISVNSESKIIVSNLVSASSTQAIDRSLMRSSPRMLRSSRSRYVSVEATHAPRTLFDLSFFDALPAIPDVGSYGEDSCRFRLLARAIERPISLVDRDKT